MDHHQLLKKLKPTREFFTGIDSDGCVFDTMEIKQKEFFIPNGIKYFNLFRISGLVRETWEFVNLYSVYRGLNRFPALVKVFELLGAREEVKKAAVELPDLSPLKAWITEESKLGNSALRNYCKANPDLRLTTVLEWSEAINNDIGKWLKGLSPFRNASECIERMSHHADQVVVSQTPVEALEREWKEHGIDRFVGFIAGQEHGTKTEHIALGAKGKYPDDRILVIGDAPGDMEAAMDNRVLFYPVIPGREVMSWARLKDEAFERFLEGSYRGRYQEEMLRDFKDALPEKAPWEK